MISVWKLWLETECTLISSVGLTIKKWLLFFAVSWAWFWASRKVYLLWDLIGQLAWVERKDSEGHLYETTRVWTIDKGRSDWRTGQRCHTTGNAGQTAKDTHKDTHRVLQPVVCEWAWVESQWECDDLQAAVPLFHTWVFVWRAARRRYRAVCLMSLQVRHINIFCLCQPAGALLPNS